ncbi:hypothetical protein AWQ23_01300 [Picosynechococcus sp. PCC 73109]|nr:hypothetical protein AWQ23_01300 [Picosynechococcus sp. PCC 73109]
MLALEVPQFMGHDSLEFCFCEDFDQSRVDHHKGFLAPHSKGIGIGHGILLDVEIRRCQIQHLGGFLEEVMEVGQLAIAHQNARREIIELKNLLCR